MAIINRGRSCGLFHFARVIAQRGNSSSSSSIDPSCGCTGKIKGSLHQKVGCRIRRDREKSGRRRSSGGRWEGWCSTTRAFGQVVEEAQASISNKLLRRDIDEG